MNLVLKSDEPNLALSSSYISLTKLSNSSISSNGSSFSAGTNPSSSFIRSLSGEISEMPSINPCRYLPRESNFLLPLRYFSYSSLRKSSKISSVSFSCSKSFSLPVNSLYKSLFSSRSLESLS